MNDDTRGSLGLLPKESELGFIVENGENVKYNETTGVALKLAKIINPQNRNEVLYLNNNNVPTIAGIKYVSMNPTISKDLISKGKNSQSKNNEVKGKQFFVSNGKYYTVQLFEPITAEIA